MGLIHQAVDDEAFEDAVNALTSKLASMPTRGLRKRPRKALHAAMNHDLHAQLKLELDLCLRPLKPATMQKVCRPFWKSANLNSQEHECGVDGRQRSVA